MKKSLILFIIIFLLSSFTAYAPSHPEMMQETMDFCDSPESCMEFCNNNPEKCRFIKYRESVMVMGDVGDFEYKYEKGSEFSNTDIAYVQYYEKNFYFDEVEPEFFVLSRMMEGLEEEFEPEDYSEVCSDPNADIVINKMKELGKFDINKACSEFGEYIGGCNEKSLENCENMMKGPIFRLENTEIRCDGLERDTLYNECIAKYVNFGENYNVDEECENRWKSIEFGCELKKNYCKTFEEQAEVVEEQSGECDNLKYNEEAYQLCLASITKTESTCDLGEECNNDYYLLKCKTELGSNVEHAKEMSKQQCEQFVSDIMTKVEDNCMQRERTYNHCIESAQKHCGPLQKTLENCSDITEEKIREAMVRHSERMCKLMENEEFESLLKAKKYLSGEFDVVLDQGLENVADVDQENEELLKEKDFNYKVKRFLGLMKEQEEEEAIKLKENSFKLKKAAEVLTSLASETEDSKARALLLEQADEVEEQAYDLEKLSEEKLEKATGLFSIFD